MSRKVILLIITIFTAAIFWRIQQTFLSKKYIELGDLSQTTGWVYLSGLTDNINSSQEVTNRQILDELGKKLKIHFYAVIPAHRDAAFKNKLHWPHSPKNNEVLQTYHEILNILPRIKITGWIGFSNGGFFLNQLVQKVALNAPVFSIGSGGWLYDETLENDVHLLIGRYDEWHYQLALNFFKQIKKRNGLLKSTLTEFEGGHAMEKAALGELVSQILSGNR